MSRPIQGNPDRPDAPRPAGDDACRCAAGGGLPRGGRSITPGTGANFSLIPPQNATGNFTKIVQRVPVRIRINAGEESRKVLVPGLSLTVEVDTKREGRDQVDPGRTGPGHALMSAAISAAPPEKADLTAWLAVVAGAIGALMATLDISIVNSALPTIQGEIGASATEGTWIATSYLVAEIVIIPLTAWLERVFGLKRFLLIAAVLFTGFSIVCGLSTTLTMMIVGRVGQGFTGGAMIPTGMTIIATRLPRHQQPVGTALFGSTLILGR
jgi:hypothetical protein